MLSNLNLPDPEGPLRIRLFPALFVSSLSTEPQLNQINTDLLRTVINPTTPSSLLSLSSAALLSLEGESWNAKGTVFQAHEAQDSTLPIASIGTTSLLRLSVMALILIATKRIGQFESPGSLPLGYIHSSLSAD